MNILVVNKNNIKVAVVSGDEVILNNAQDALDLIANVGYNYECDKMIIYKKNITEDLFELKNGLAGEVMQKYVNYKTSLAIIGEFELYHSKSLNSLILESNKGNSIIFKSTEEEALEVLCKG
ncbi:MAG: DUF4180 domain-containing protein [Mobilitalea sp.]